MQSRVRVAKHPMHPMLIVFPSSIFPLMLVLDLLYLYYNDLTFWTIGFWLGIAGVLTTAAAMIPGIVDLAGIPNEARAHRTAFQHFVVGTLTLVAYAGAVALRWPAGSGADQVGFTIGLDVVGVLLIVVQGWLGGELVYRHHLGVLSTREGAEPTPFKGAETSGAPAAPRRRDDVRP